MSPSLQGKKIIVTREKNKASLFSKKIETYGGVPIEVPLLKIVCKDEARNEAVLSKLQHFQWIFFTSANGVDCFFQTLHRYGISSQMIKEKKIAAVGVKTEECLQTYGMNTDFVPTVYNAETMAEEFLNAERPGPILLVRGNLSRDVLPEVFAKSGIDFDWIEVYETRHSEEYKEKLLAVLKQSYDFITFTSPSAVDAFYQIVGAAVDKPVVSIGTTTDKRLEELGFLHRLTAKEFTVDGMIQCMIDFIERSKEK